MKNAKPPRPRTRKTSPGRKTTNRDPVSRGPISQEGTEPGTLMPHERDEVAEAGEDGPDEDAKQAFDDVQSGQVDTDLRGTARNVFKRSPAKPGKSGSS